jgi:hypothetical protein
VTFWLMYGIDYKRIIGRTRRKRDDRGDVETDYAYGISLGYSRADLLSGSPHTPHFPHHVMSESLSLSTALNVDCQLIQTSFLHIIYRIQDTNHRSGREPRDETDIQPSKSIYAVV